MGKTIRDIMTPEVIVADVAEPLRNAAERMAARDVGSLPVAQDGKLVGMLTDRDIVVRAVAMGLDGQTPVREVMTADIKYCYDDEDLTHVSRNMSELGVRRLPVVDREKRLVGMLALSNVAHAGENVATNDMLQGVASPH